MDIKQVLVQIFFSTILAITARRYRTRDRLSEWFCGLEFDWIAGVGLAIVIVLVPVVLCATVPMIVYWMR